MTACRRYRGLALGSGALIASLLTLALMAAPRAQEPSAARQSREDLLLFHERLIWAADLDAEAGHVTSGELAEAITRFRARIASTATGPLGKAELERLQALAEGEMDQTGYVQQTDPANGIKLWLPLRLIETRARPASWGGSEWSSSEGDIYVTTFRHTLKTHSINSFYNVLIRRRSPRITYEQRLPDSFVVEGEFMRRVDGQDRPTLFHARAYQLHDTIIGLLVQYRPERRAVMGRVVNAMASRFQSDNGWRELYLGECGPAIPESDAHRVRIIFATNRLAASDGLRQEGPVALDRLFYAEKDQRLHVGCADVSVPSNLEARAGLATADGGEADPARHFHIPRYRHLGSSDPGEPGRLLSIVGDSAVQRTGRARRRALIFVHGYNVGFHHALMRIAHLARETRYPGPVYLFSWPSSGLRTGYLVDVDEAEQAEAYLESTMRMIMSDRDVDRLDVIAHSMGSQPVLRVLRSFARSFESRSGGRGWGRLGEVIFAAPDVGRDLFREKIASIFPFADRVTLYASSTDCAMYASRLLRANLPRAGDATDGPLVMDGVDTIDATGQAPSAGVFDRVTRVFSWDRLSSWFSCNHSYFADRRALLDDIASLLKGEGRARESPHVRAPERLREGRTRGGSVYWVLGGETK